MSYHTNQPARRSSSSSSTPLAQRLTQLQPGHVVALCSSLTALITIASLLQLRNLIAQHEGAPASLPTHTNWRDVAHRAVQHVEHLPGWAGNTEPLGTVYTADVAKADATLPVLQASSSQLESPVVVSSPAAPAPAASPSTGPGAGMKAAGIGSKPVKPVAEVTAAAVPDQCGMMPNTELWGDVVTWGSSNKVTSAAECCRQCRQHKATKAEDADCNVWVWCGDKDICGQQYMECWLKHLVHPQATKPARQGPEVGWTSGVIDAAPEQVPADVAVAAGASGAAAGGGGKRVVRKYHTVTSAQGSAVHWQTRVHYYWFLKQKAICEQQQGDACEMGGFTRLLHSGQADDLMDEIPTFVAQPLSDEVVPHAWYPVLNRPYAFMQWVQAANISEQYVLMSEPDHIFLRPLHNFMRGDAPAAFPFFYIEPSKPDNLPYVAKFVPGGKISRKEAEMMAPIGNSPTIMTWQQMRAVMPAWHDLAVRIFKDKDTNAKWGWVQEMYAFTIALYNAGIKHVDLHLNMMSQPPWDTKMELSPAKPYYILHYTYGCDYTLDGKFTPGKHGDWRFDKRTYASTPPPRHLGQPPPGMKNDLVRALISSINEATANIPCWDQYQQAGHLVDCPPEVDTELKQRLKDRLQHAKALPAS